MKRTPTPARLIAELRAGSFPPVFRPAACSVAVLWAAGALTCTSAAWGQSAGTILKPNTVPVLRGVVAGQAVVNAPVATGTGSLMTIDQRSARAVIDWRSFNIGSGSEVRFNQPGTTASTLNRIYNADPTIIQGKLTSAGPIDPVTKLPTAGGQIILINQNGILFDRGAQVNAYSLVASTLNLSNDFFARGLLAGDDVSRPVAAFSGGYRIDGDGSTDPSLPSRGAIRIGASGADGAAVPALKALAGGNILLFAPVIDNKNGLIVAPDGQVILAAGSKVYLAAERAQAEGVRGFLVEVSADDGDVNLTSLVRNQGQISSDRGNVTLAGLMINQEGRVSASTAMLYNGSVWLKATTKAIAREGAPLEPQKAGTVTLAAGSVTETPLDTSDTTTLAESQDYASAVLADDRRGRVRVEGQNIVHHGLIEARGGAVTLQAASPVEGQAGRIYLGPGSRIDAAGNWADVDHDSNFATFRVTSSELKDAPDQKTGILKGATVTVDLRKSSSILDISGYVDGRRRTVAEKATPGGTVSLQSSGDVIQRPDAEIDVSGGGYRYGGGAAQTTRLLGDDGKLYDIASAPEQRQYTAQLDRHTRVYSRWGQTEVFDNPLGGLGQTEAGYVEGRAGGSLDISAPNGLVLDGVLKGGATIGPSQLARAPAGATLTLGTDTNRTNTATPVAGVRFTTASVDHVGVLFTPESTLPDAALERLDLATDMLYPASSAGAAGATARFGQVEVNSRGLIDVPADVALDVGIGNALVLRGHQIDIAGAVNAPAGSVLLQTRPVPSSDPTPSPERVSVLAGGSVSVAGVWLNNASRDGSPLGPTLPSAFVAAGSGTAKSSLVGGSIGVSAGSFDVQPGATLDVSGGGSIDRSGRVSGGNAGSITLAADRNPEPSFNRAAGDLLGHSIGTGGSLSMTVGQVQIGGEAAVADEVLRLSPEFFQHGGFTSYAIAGAQGLKIVTGTDLQPKAESWVVSSVEAQSLATGNALSSIATREFLPPAQRPAASVSFSASGSSLAPAVLTMQEGSSITTDPGGRVTLDAVNGMTVNGRITASGGTIALNLRGPSGSAPVLVLGDEAELLANGAFVAQPSTLGLRQGRLLDGGSVSLTATRGSIEASERSRIDVSGTAETLDVASANPQVQPFESRTVGSNAGTITVRAQERSTFASQIDGHAGSPTNAGGSFAMEFTNRNERQLPSEVSVDRRIIVTQAPSSFAAQAGVVDAAIDSNRLAAGGFDKLRLQSGGRIEFRGQTALEMGRGVQLDAPEIRVADGVRVGIESASVVLANSFGAVGSPGFQGTTASRNNGAASVPVATRQGTGTLHVNADTIDVLGDVTLTGVSNSTLASRNDLRLSGRVVGDPQTDAGAVLVGSLVSAGDIDLQAAQLYPTTRSSFTVAVQSRAANGTTTPLPDGTLTISRGDTSGGDVLSADGSLTLRADRIAQGGIVKAPLGRIVLDAGSRLELASSSVTSVSANGLTLPYGTTVDQRDWLYTPTNSRVDINPLTQPPAKTISLSAPSIAIAQGATVDLTGGGDVQATEFVPGTGGSTDTLLKDNTFAIMPAAKLASMPVDREIAGRKDLGLGPFTARPDALAYDTIHIGPGAVVPEGDYVLLPGRYALLPGAFEVRLQPGTIYANLLPGQTASQVNGDVVVPGYRKVAGTSVRENQGIGVVVRPGSAAKVESDYALSDASFFAARADTLRLATPTLPGDGGRLAITASSNLTLGGRIAVAAASADDRDATVDIAAPKIAVVDRADSTAVGAGFLQVEAAELSRIGGSLLLGGTRTDTADGVRLTASATEVVFANPTQALQAPELLVAATDSISVREGSTLRGAGKAVGSPERLLADPQGALLRLASGAAAEIDRGAVSGAGRGTVTIAAGATLEASGSIAVDATRTLRNDGQLAVASGGALSLASGSMTLGGTASQTDGLVLGDAALRGFDALGSLTLRSYGSVDLAAGVAVGGASLKALVLDTPLLRSADPTSNGTATVSAQTITLRNSGSATASSGSAAPGAGSLALMADTLTLAEGAKAIEGFDAVALRARGDVVFSGVGALRSAAATQVEASRVVGAPGADQTLVAGTGASGTPRFELSLTRGSASPDPAAPAFGGGGRLHLEGRTIRADTTLSMKSGIVSMKADDGVALGARAVVDVSAYSRSFAGHTETADAGSVSVDAGAGDVIAETGSKILLAGGATAGDAGRLDLAGRSVQLGGVIDARASTAAGQGRVAIDVAGLSDFSALNRQLEAGGFAASRTLRVRQGDIRVASTDTVKAHAIHLEADAGRIDVDGRLDASAAAGGGTIELFADAGIGLSGHADASATSTVGDANSAPANGGLFSADARNGTLTMASGATVDVRPGAKGTPGRAVFTASRTPGNGVDVDLKGTVSTRRAQAGPAGEVIVQGRTVVAGVSEPTAQDVQQWADEHAAFMSSVDVGAVAGAITTDGTRHVRGVLELQSAGDFTLGTDWDLTSPQWLTGSGGAAKESGTLTVRAAGDVVIRRSLGAPDDRLVDAPTWSIQMAAGADLSAASPLALQSLAALGTQGNFRMAGADAPVLTDRLDPSGNPYIDTSTGEVAQVTLDQAAKIRTGTGNISIAAGGDFVFETGSFADQDAKRVIYTAGRPTAPQDTSNFVLGIDTPWADGGGDVTIRAQRDAVGSSNQAVNGWLRRPRGSVDEIAGSTGAGWFVHRPNFQQNVGALGGGNVSIDAGNDVLNLSAAVPTMGRAITHPDGSSTLEVTGGGNLDVRAGNRIEGGDYLVARGAGSLRAGSSVGAGTPTQVHLMGESDDAGRSGASMTIAARTGVTLQSVDNPTVLALPISRSLGPLVLAAELDVDGNPLLDPDTGNPFYLPVPAYNFDDSLRATATFYTYAPTSSVDIKSLSGDVTLGGRPLDKPAFASDPRGGTGQPVADGSAYPGIVNAVAFSGAIRGTPVRVETTLFPTPLSALGLYAATDLSQLNFFVSDRALPEVAAWDKASLASSGFLAVSANVPRTPLELSASPYRYDVVADAGSIESVDLTLPDRARVQAGLDIVGVNLRLQNQHETDLTLVRAVDGDVRPNTLSIAGPGRLLVQAGRNIDAGTNVLQAVGNTGNSSLSTAASAHLTFIAGVKGDVDVTKLDGAFAEFTELNKALNEAIALYKLLNAERDPQGVLGAGSVEELARANPKYLPFVELDKRLPQILGAYRNDLRSGRLPLGPTPDSERAAALYSLLNAETDETRVRRIVAATSLSQLAGDAAFGGYAGFADLDRQYPALFADYRVRRGNGFLPSGLMPIVFGAVLDDSVAKVFPGASVTGGNIDSYRTSIQTVGGSGIDLIAPLGDITVGLTTPRVGREVGVVTTGGGGIRSYLGGNFNINQGKVVTAQGGDILIFTSRGNIDAGRGARTSQTSPAPVREPVIQDGVVVGFISKIPAGFSGSGIQTLSSDPDGQGPLNLSGAGTVLLFTPAGYVDAGEAGIVSGGDIVIVAQTVLNSANISASGSSVGVPVAASGSLASSLASGGNSNSTTKAADDAASNATKAARAAASAEGMQKPNILTVEVMGFGDRNCKEQDKDCFAK